MSNYEIISILASLLAVVVASISLVRARKVNDKQIEMQKVISELSGKQLELIKSKEMALSVASIDVDLVDYESNYHFIITNNGGSSANRVTFEIEGEYNPIAIDEIEQKFPISCLRAGKSIELVASLNLGAPDCFNVNVSWENPNGNVKHDTFIVCI